MELHVAEKVALDQVMTMNIKENIGLRAQLVLMGDEIKTLQSQLEKAKAELLNYTTPSPFLPDPA